MRSVERPTVVAVLLSGPIEYRWEQRGGPVVLIFHGGHKRVRPPRLVPRVPAPVFHRGLRAATAGLAGAGVLLAAGTAVPAFPRLGAGSGLTFAAVAVAGAFQVAGLLRARRWAVRTAAAGLAGQPVVALAAAWQPASGMPASKAASLLRLGVQPQVGGAMELAYGTVGTVLLVWLLLRWRRRSHGHGESSDRAGDRS